MSHSKTPGSTGQFDAHHLLTAIETGLHDFYEYLHLGILSNRFKHPPNHPPPVKSTSKGAAVKAPTIAVASGTKQLSGKAWVKLFQGGTKLTDLDGQFQKSVNAFLGALKSATPKLTDETGGKIKNGATNYYQIIATIRPWQRAYLMHWCWRITRPKSNTYYADPKSIAPKPGVSIEWWHGTTEKSVKAAQEMFAAYGLNPHNTVPPSLTSNHIEGKAIDLNVAWNGALTIARGDGKPAVKIDSDPKSEMNIELMAVAATYGVFHYDNLGSKHGKTVGMTAAKHGVAGVQAGAATGIDLFDFYKAYYTGRSKVTLHKKSGTVSALEVDENHWSIDGG
jgi:hypothetical protein